jgi:hypothetical protein
LLSAPAWCPVRPPAPCGPCCAHMPMRMAAPKGEY